ncbi:MAG TPA: 30S ribosomal protein S9 [Candidatus Lokiarchaeia archaeon]|nr:30S ribosomal protein S9 [Candidatus Lokiarchaeia archaeon]
MVKVIQMVGKRKRAIAQAVLKAGKGIIRVNNVPVDKIEPQYARWKIQEVLKLLEGEKELNEVDINVKVAGGGVLGQYDAARIAISKALNAHMKKKRVTKHLKDYDKTLLSGDSRRTEPKKWGGRSARARVQKSYR